MNIKSRLSDWLGRSIGNRIRFVSVATAFGLVTVIGIATFPLLFYQAKSNFNEHAHNNFDRISDTLQSRMVVTQQSLEQLSKSSFIVNSLVDSSGREVYLTPTLRDFHLPGDLPVKLTLLDSNITPFAGNTPGYSVISEKMRKLVASSLKQHQLQTYVETNGDGKSMGFAIPIFYPPSANYEGVLLAMVDVGGLLALPERYLDEGDCLTITSSGGALLTINCDARTLWGNISRPLQEEQGSSEIADITINYGETSSAFIRQLLIISLIYFLISVGAVAGTFFLSRRASQVFVNQIESLSVASLALAASPNAQTRVTWKHPDEIGKFVDTFNAMVDRLQEFQMSLEATVEERTNELRIILDNVVDGIITIDEMGIVKSFNPAAESIFAYAAKEVVGNNLKMLMPEPYYSEHDGYLQNYRDSGVPRVIGLGSRELSGRRKDGTTFPMDIAISSSIQNEQPLFIAVVRDITERKRIDQMKSEFVSTVSHELRTPLTSISGALGLIAGGVLGAIPDQAKQMIDMAHKNSLRLGHLINDLLDMEKIVAGKMTLVLQKQSLMALVHQALESISAYGDQYNVSFKLIAQEEARVEVEAGRLIQVLNNFLSNAAKFTPQGGQVEIAIRRMDGNIRVEVIDQGMGIPANFRDRIFQKFSQADSSDTRQKGGTGLGLAISKELIERMHGKIGFDSVEGHGATFYFELPCVGE